MAAKGPDFYTNTGNAFLEVSGASREHPKPEKRAKTLEGCTKTRFQENRRNRHGEANLAPFWL